MLSVAFAPVVVEEAERVTLPAKPFKPPRIMVELPEVPGRFRGLGMATMLKSTMFKISTVQWDRVPLVPVMLTAYVPDGVAWVVDTVKIAETELSAGTITFAVLKEA